MSATVERTPARPAVACPRCGAEVPPERDWCLECGEAARTEILPARGWKLPIAIVLGVVLLAGVVVAIAFVQLSSDAGDAARLAQAPPPATTTLPAGLTTPAVPLTTVPTTPSTATTATTPTTPTTPGAVRTWPPGRTAYTVVLISSTSPGAAQAAAQKLLRQGRGDPVGTLRSDAFRSLTPGYVVVFSGQYPTLAAAQRAATGWHAKGSRGAYAKLVSPSSDPGAPPPAAPTGGAPAPSAGGAAPATP